jgi:hypothetical protein
MNLFTLYELNFTLMYIHKLSMSDIDGLIPWERDLYVDRLGQYLEKLDLERKQEELNRQNRRRRY